MPFLLMAIIFVVCLVASNLFASKIFTLGAKIVLPGAVIIFPISYIVNDCLSEVYGFRKSRLVIWIGFMTNIAFVLTAYLVTILPGAPFWDGDEAFQYVFSAAPRATVASMVAYLAGSTINAWVMSRMKVAQEGRNFWLRAVLSSLAGEAADSLIFIPFMFWTEGIWVVLTMMLCQVSAKVLYEVIMLPVTTRVVKHVKAIEGIDVYDRDISYNPFKIKDI